MLSLIHIRNLIIVCFAIIFVYLSHKKKQKEHLTSKPHIWCYWETMEGRQKPAYIDLCHDSKFISLMRKQFGIIYPN